MTPGKWGVLVAWLVMAGAFLAPEGGAYATYGRIAFWLTLAAHVVESFVFLPRLRAAGGSLASHVFGVMLYGVFHMKSLPEAASREA